MIELNSTIVKDFLEFKIDLEELVRQGLQLNNPLQQNLWIEGIPL